MKQNRRRKPGQKPHQLPSLRLVLKSPSLSQTCSLGIENDDDDDNADDQDNDHDVHDDDDQDDDDDDCSPISTFPDDSETRSVDCVHMFLF